MRDIAIRAQNLSKQYTIDVARRSYDSLREHLAGSLKSLVRRNGKPSGRDTFWALRDICFEVKPGEIVGIIGRNGAGKSTLLKILSRIMEPTSGRAEIHGRVGSLLEVGTGFDRELTGRDNLYLSGAILGMKKAEIDRKFDEIVDFSGVEKFIDTPVKRYSSGMYVRLAFAVAAHLEPEILLVDEVLAVGDAAFQKKCLGKMEEVAEEGRTILFVSHNVAAVHSLCGKGILLESGKLVRQGSAQEVVRHYLESVTTAGALSLDQRQDRSGDGTVRLVSMKVESPELGKIISSTSRLKITIRYRSNKPILALTFLVGIYDCSHTGAKIFTLNSDSAGGFCEALPAEGSVTCVTDPINLTQGRCYVNIALLNREDIADYIQQAAFFDVEPNGECGLRQSPSRDLVMCVLKQRWSIDES